MPALPKITELRRGHYSYSERIKSYGNASTLTPNNSEKIFPFIYWGILTQNTTFVVPGFCDVSQTMKVSALEQKKMIRPGAHTLVIVGPPYESYTIGSHVDRFIKCLLDPVGDQFNFDFHHQTKYFDISFSWIGRGKDKSKCLLATLLLKNSLKLISAIPDLVSTTLEAGETSENIKSIPIDVEGNDQDIAEVASNEEIEDVFAEIQKEKQKIDPVLDQAKDVKKQAKEAKAMYVENKKPPTTTKKRLEILKTAGRVVISVNPSDSETPDESCIVRIKKDATSVSLRAIGLSAALGMYLDTDKYSDTRLEVSASAIQAKLNSGIDAGQFIKDLHEGGAFYANFTHSSALRSLILAST